MQKPIVFPHVRDIKPATDLAHLPRPFLTDEERRYPKYLRDLIIASKKCDSIQKCDLISAKQLQKLLEYSENDVIAVSKMEHYRVAKFLTGQSFTNFHLQWHNQEPRATLMRKWLTFHADKNLLDEIQPSLAMQSDVVKYVAAKWIDGCWYRGFVQGVVQQKHFLVYFIDQGNTELLGLNEIRLLPKELSATSPMCFRAILADISVDSDEETLKYGRTIQKFLSKMRKGITFQCRIKELIGFDEDWTPGNGKASVILNDLIPRIMLASGAKHWNSVNHLIRSSLREDAKTVFGADIPLPEELQILKKHKVHHGVTIRNGVVSGSHPSPYKICYIANPGLFYVKNAGGTDLADAAGNDSKLQDFYNNANSGELDPLKIRTQRLLVGRAYVWLDQSAKTWFRVIVRRVDTPPGTCFLFRLDIGDHLLGRETEMMEIKPEFTHWPALAIQCHLVDVKPLGGGVWWSKSAVSAFRKLAESTPEFLGFGLSKEERIVSKAKSISYGVLLIDKSYRAGYSVQARLTLMGAVDPDGFLTGNYHLAFLCHEGIPSYDPVKMVKNVIEKEARDFPSIRDFTVKNLPKLGSFTETIRPSQREAKYLETTASFKGSLEVQPVYEPRRNKRLVDVCYCEGDSCRIDCEVLESKRFCTPTMEPEYRYLKCVGYGAVRTDIVTSMGPFTAMFGEYLGAVRISHADGPGVFYIQMASKTKELEFMMQDIGELVKDSPPCGSDVEGYIVAALVYSEELIPNWHRAYVSNVTGSVCKVILIDVGSILNVPLKNVRNLPEYFWCVPSYCRRVHLDVESKCLRNCKWTSNLNRIFTAFVRLNWGSVYLAWKPHPASADVEVVDYGQDVCFDPEKEQWWNGGSIPMDFPIVIQNEYDKKLLYHLLHSVGINFVWESRSKGPLGEFRFEEVEKLFL